MLAKAKARPKRQKHHPRRRQTRKNTLTHLSLRIMQQPVKSTKAEIYKRQPSLITLFVIRLVSISLPSDSFTLV